MSTQVRATDNQEVGKWPEDTHWGGIARNWTDRNKGNRAELTAKEDGVAASQLSRI